VLLGLVANVLVVGATSAIAQEIARVYAARGDRLFLLGRDETKLGSLAEGLGRGLVGSESANFDDLGGNEARVERALATLGSIDVAVIAHGWLGDQIESEAFASHAAAVITTNFTSVVSFVVPLVNYFEAQRRGSLVVLSSVAGDRGRPRNYTYGAAKGALTLYLQGVRSRLFQSAREVRVVTIRLGPVDTPMTRDHAKNALFGEPRAVARAIVHSARRGPQDVYVPWYWQPIMAAVRGLPERIFQRFGFLAGR
jgi:decaprenylphospho-beta-D-erythro-pentofuranosid-2-ulose 2-reductase